MKLVTRAEWGARPGRALSTLAVSTVTVHWGGGPLGAIEHSKCAGVVRSYQAYHLDTQKWADIAYNLLVCQHGDVFEGRGLGKRSAANGDGPSNSASYAICYIGGTGDPFTDAGKDGINAAAEMLVPGSRFWKVHGDWVQTDCPGSVIRDWVRSGHPRATPAKETYVPGTFVLTLAHSGLVLEVEGASAADAAPIVQAPLTGEKHQLVRFEDAGDNWAYIIFEHSGKTLDHDPNSGVVHQIVKMPGNPNQLWRKGAYIGNVIALVSKSGGTVLDMPGLNPEPGARVATWQWNGGANQLVTVTSV